MLNTYIN